MTVALLGATCLALGGGNGAEARTLTGANCVASPPSGVTTTTLVAGGRSHALRVYVPTTRRGRERLPVVLDWHGLGQSGQQQATVSDYESLAERERFIVVHPTGVQGPYAGWFDVVGRNWEIFNWQDPFRDDIVFANAVIDEMLSAYCGDERRVYSTGMSNGGFFTSRLVCELERRIAAAVSVSASFEPSNCQPSRAVPYRAYHGTADPIVQYHGGGSPVLNSIVFPPVQAVQLFDNDILEEFADFAVASGCDPQPVTTVVSSTVVTHDFTRCPDKSPRTFVEIIGGGHDWFRDKATVDVTVDGWNFMSQHTLP